MSAGERVMVHLDTGEARQQFALCFHGLPVDPDPQPDHHEICEAAWIDPARLDTMPIHPSSASGSCRRSPTPTQPKGSGVSRHRQARPT
jgi:hypothetical protein